MEQLANTIKQAYRTDDADKYASAFSDGFIVSMPGTPPVRGRGPLRQIFESRPPLPPGATFEVRPTELEIINAEWAYAFGTDTLTIPNPDGGDPTIETLTFMVLIRKTQDGRKTFREVDSADQL
ncbi:MAG: YybH family protein [Pyrinomonadaceae bacterium]